MVPREPKLPRADCLHRVARGTGIDWRYGSTAGVLYGLQAQVATVLTTLHSYKLIHSESISDNGRAHVSLYDAMGKSNMVFDF